LVAIAQAEIWDFFADGTLRLRPIYEVELARMGELMEK